MKVCLTAFILFYASLGFAQHDDNPNNLRVKIFELSVKTIPPESLKLPFQSIKIIDYRFDTSKLGFRLSKKFLSSNNVFEKIILRAGIEKGIENFYNEYYKYNFTPNGKILLISIKKLWINNMPERQGENQRKNIDKLSQQDIYAKFEYYIGSVNTYVPLKRIDTVFRLTPDKKVEDYDSRDENKLPFFCFALEKMIENVNYEFYIKDLEKKKKMSVEDIEKYNATTKNIPILNEPTKKGVFLTFDEFKNNQPSVASFSKRKILKRKIYEIADEKGNVIIDYFAYNDGEKLAMAKHLADLLATNISQDNYGIYKVNNSFQFFENYLQYTVRETNTGVSNQGIPTYILVRVPRQIDMETGKTY
jgi:hypothetical protein